ncbi:MAG: hypothetical protein IPN86_15585 [Saprospiraceae bacterium]|nr:hypothetical protein [Saprospiraceae bacterium]
MMEPLLKNNKNNIMSITMRSLKIFIILISINGCTNFHISRDISRDWNNITVENLAKTYVQYKKNGLRQTDSCYESTLDLYYKIIDINRYPFGIGLEKVKVEIATKKIGFDSIMCMTTQSSGSFDPEHLYPNYYFVFAKGKLKDVLIFEPQSLELSKSNETLQELNDRFLKVHKRKDGNDLSLLVLTKILPKWDFEISKIVINN